MNVQVEQSASNPSQTRSFNPNDHVMQLKSREGAKDYLPVQWRLVWFREKCPNGTIETEMVHLDLDRETEEDGFEWNAEKRRSEKVIKRAKGFVIFRAVVKDGKGGVATGTKTEKAASFADYCEKAETGAIGRALAALGYGTQFAPELSEAHRIVDSPCDRQPAEGANGHASNSRTAEPTAITEQQLISIRKLCEHLGKPEPENITSLSYLAAKELISELSGEYREAREAADRAKQQQEEQAKSQPAQVKEPQPTQISGKDFHVDLTSPAPPSAQQPGFVKAIEKAKARVEAVHMDWSSLKRDALKICPNDADLTPLMLTKIVTLIGKIETEMNPANRSSGK